MNNNPYTRYAGMAMQLLVTIGLGVFIGYKLDQYANTKPWATVFCALFFTIGALIGFVRSLPKE